MTTPKRPVSGQWIRRADYTQDGHRAEVYHSIDGLIVVSGVDPVEDQHGARHEFHLSVSSFGVRPSRDRVRVALAAFGMRGATEDNAGAETGRARHFWLPTEEN